LIQCVHGINEDNCPECNPTLSQDILEAVPAWGKGQLDMIESLQERVAALEENCPDCVACAGFAEANHLAEQVVELKASLFALQRVVDSVRLAAESESPEDK
jgi:hypothetical protein